MKNTPILLTGLAIALSSCAPSPSGGLGQSISNTVSNISLPWKRANVNTSALVAAGVPAAEAYRQGLGVAGFTGNYGSQFGPQLEGTLASHTVEGQTYFSLVDRTSLDRVMDEIVRGSSGMMSSSTAAKLGQLTGAQGILTGSADYRADTRQVVQQHLKTKGGIGFRGVNCNQRTVTLSVNARLIGVKNGSIIYSKVIQKQASDEQCSDALTGGLASDTELLAQAANMVNQQILFDLAPHEVKLNVRLLDAKDITPASAATAYASGLDFARSNRIDRACEFWTTAYNQNRGNYATLYAMGVCAESKGSLSEALKWYLQADRTLSKPNSTISEAINRVQELLRSRK